MVRIKNAYLIAASAVPISVALAAAALLALRDRSPSPVPETPTVQAAADSTPDVDESPMDAEAPKKLAVTSEQFDAVGGVLDGLGAGYGYEVVETEALRDPKAATRFDTIFLTCAEADADDDPALIKGLREFVSAGGTLYASDLRFDLLAAAFPEFVDRPSVAQGVSQQVTASVVSPELRAVVGNEIPLHFWLDGWRPAAFRGDEVSVLLKGRFRTTAGVSMEAPLLVKFPFGNGIVIFTSFHNEMRNRGDEIKLMKLLTLKTVTAGLEAREAAVLADDGYATLAVTASTAAESAAVNRVFQHERGGPLRFRLGFEDGGATMRLDVVAPDGTKTTERGDSSFAIDAPNAAAGRWQYTVIAEDASQPEFPSVLIVGGANASGVAVASKANPILSRETSGNVLFEEVSLGNKSEAAARPLRIAVTTPKFDDMGRLLRALGEGYKYDEIEPEILPNVGSLRNYDIVFLTCNGWPGAWSKGTTGGMARPGISYGEMREDIAERVGRNLRQFVRNGGTLYGSDLREDLIGLAFPKRLATWEIDREALAALNDIELNWIKAVSPGVKPRTLSDVIAEANLSKELSADHDPLLVVLERSSMMKSMPGLSSSQDNAMNLFAALFNPNAVRPRREVDTISNAAVRSLLERAKLHPNTGDVTSLTTALSNWKATINNAARSRPRAKVDKARDQIVKASRKLIHVRDRLIKDVQGAAKQYVEAEVEDSGLKELLGATLKLSFADNAWEPADFRGQDVQVLLRGKYTTVEKLRHTAPLLVKFREGQGTVIFTSFHNEDQNSEKELDLLRYLVFTAVTAKEDAVALETMLSAGFSPVKRNQNHHSAGHPSVTKIHTSPGPDPLRFGLSFNGSGARLRLTLVAPNGARCVKEVESTLLIQATGAPAGDWTYTVEALKVPYENFPYNVSIGKGESKGPVRGGATPKRRP